MKSLNEKVPFRDILRTREIRASNPNFQKQVMKTLAEKLGPEKAKRIVKSSQGVSLREAKKALTILHNEGLVKRNAIEFIKHYDQQRKETETETAAQEIKEEKWQEEKQERIKARLEKRRRLTEQAEKRRGWLDRWQEEKEAKGSKLTDVKEIIPHQTKIDTPPPPEPPDLAID